MDVRNGDLYASREEALAAGVPEEYAVQIQGREEAVKALAAAVAEREALRDALRNQSSDESV